MANPLEVAGWNQAAGWTGADVVTATAVALRSSGGDPAAPGGLYGLSTTGDGAAQAKAARERQRASGWDVFPAYRDRSYLLFVPLATAAAGAQTVVGPPAATVTNLASGAEAAGQVAGWLTHPDAWQRVVKVVAGVILITIAGVMVGIKTSRAVVIDPLQKLARGAGRVAAESDAVRASTPLNESR